MTNSGVALHGFANSSFSAAQVILLQVHILHAPVLKHESGWSHMYSYQKEEVWCYGSHQTNPWLCHKYRDQEAEGKAEVTTY